MEDAFHVTRRDDLTQIANRMAAAGVCSAPLFAAAAAGQIALVQIRDNRTPWPVETVSRPRRPVVVLLAGDPGWAEPTFGPSQWECARHLRRWAAGAMVHGAAGEPHQYLLAATMAAVVGRFALIETTSTLAPSWQAFMAPVPTVTFLPDDGAVHPAAPVPGEVH